MLLLPRLPYAPPPDEPGLPPTAPLPAVGADTSAEDGRGLLLLLLPLLSPCEAEANGSGLRPIPWDPDLLEGRLLLGDKGG